MYLKGKKILVLILIFVFCLSLMACNNTEQAAEDGEFIYTIACETGDWGAPSPHKHYSRGPGYVRMSLVFDTLIWKDEKGFVPALAKDWQYNEQENYYLFSLQDEALWHDGQKISADDVVFTFKYMEEKPYTWVDFSIIKNIEKINDKQVKISLKEKFAPFLSNVAGTVPILPKHIYEDIEDPISYSKPEAFIGSGPFKLVDYNKEQGTYLYEAFADYYFGKPEVDKIKFVKVSTEMVTAALLKGEVDAASVPPEMLDKLKEKGLKPVLSDHQGIVKLMFNHQKAPFNNLKFRQAIAYAIDRDELVNISQRGYALKGNPGFMSPDSPWYNSQVEQYPYDPEKAKKLLGELGYQYENGSLIKDGEKLTLELLTKGKMKRDAELIQKQLKEIGIELELKTLEDKTADSMITNWNFDIALNSHGGLGGDPFMFNRFVRGEGFNSIRYFQNEELNKLLDEQVTLLNEEERKEALFKIQEIFAQEVPFISLYYPDWYWAHDNRVDLFFTPEGIASGVPIPLNKLSFVRSANL